MLLRDFEKVAGGERYRLYAFVTLVCFSNVRKTHFPYIRDGLGKDR